MIPYAEFRPTSFDPRGLALDEQQHWLVVPVARNRDSGILAESNFHCALKELGGESETVEVHRFGHWANGWFEIILVDPSDTTRMLLAQDIERSLDNYPILDDLDYSDRESEAICAYWRGMSLRERIELCFDHDVSIFAARHDYPPGDDSDPLGSVWDRISYWVNE